jgi:hypothetical protein
MHHTVVNEKRSLQLPAVRELKHDLEQAARKGMSVSQLLERIARQARQGERRERSAG